jgi:hypothetical protein
MDSADGVTTHAIWGLTDGLPCKETIEDWQRLDFMSKSRTGKDTKRILVEVSRSPGRDFTALLFDINLSFCHMIPLIHNPFERHI